LSSEVLHARLGFGADPWRGCVVNQYNFGGFSQPANMADGLTELAPHNAVDRQNQKQIE
jgi:hypothetical protein